jgi:hypothetical protein
MLILAKTTTGIIIPEGVELSDLGTNLFKKVVRQTLYRPMKFTVRLHKQIYHATIPESVRKKLYRVGKLAKKEFIKIAPYLSIVAQILNFIPGLGVLVGLAISIGAAALTVGAKVVDAKTKARAAKKLEATKEAELDAQVAKAEADANKAADDAYDKGEPYFVQKYGLTKTMYASLNLDDKLAFLQQAVEDADAEQVFGIPLQYVIMGGILIAGSAIVFMMLKRKRALNAKRP